jgi:flagellar biosynthesis protein FliR
MNKSLIGLIGSAVLTFLGIILRLNAHAMAWPATFSYSGSASDTPWGKQEVAIGQIGMALMFAGILIFVATYFHWLFTKESDK